jgi:predicted nucleic acid-binding protein
MIERQEITRMAREADLIDDTYSSDWYVFQLERFAALVASAEREACAKLVEADPSYDFHRFACEAAAAIRARGNT